MKILKGKISMSRPMGGGMEPEDEYMKIEIEDNNSDIHFFECKVLLADMMRALTGQYGLPIEFSVKGLEYVGKTRESLPLVFEMPTDAYHNREVAVQLAKEHAKEGWTPSLYFGSRDSWFVNNGVHCARTHQYRFVDEET